MPAASTPYGFRPIRSLGGRPYATGDGASFRIPSGYGSNLFYGMPVALSGGNIVPATAGLANYLGIFVGVEYEDPTFGTIQRNYWPASTPVKDSKAAIAYVCTDPDAILQAQCSVAAYDALADVGLRIDMNLPSAPNNGSTATGLSKAGITATDAVDGEFLLLGIINAPDNINASGFVDVFGVVAGGLHIARNQYVAP